MEVDGELGIASYSRRGVRHPEGGEARAGKFRDRSHGESERKTDGKGIWGFLVRRLASFYSHINPEGGGPPDTGLGVKMGKEHSLVLGWR